MHFLTMAGAAMTTPHILSPVLCIRSGNPAKAVLLQSLFVVSGISTLLQTTFGTRLPIVQGDSIAFVIPGISIVNSTFPSCEEEFQKNLTSQEEDNLHMVRMREIQGAIIGASFFEVIIGTTGIVGALLQWITPLTIVPTIALIGLSLFDVAAAKCATHWPVALMTIALLILFSQYLSNVSVPLPTFKKDRKRPPARGRLFSLFPILLGILVSWAVTEILAVVGALAEDSPARTGGNTKLVEEASWFHVPYPFQFGLPTMSASSVIGMLVGVLVSVIESIGDYYACSKLSGAPPLPTHAINRGIFIEGIGCILAGMWCTGAGMTSYSQNLAAIRITRVGSRRVVQICGVILMIMGSIGKLGAAIVTIPEPIIGGVLCIMFAMMVSVGLANLQLVNLNSSRNLFVLGFSLFFGLLLPKWLSATGGRLTIFGKGVPDQIITVLASTPMFVGGFLAFVLDNTIPGTYKERGIDKWKQDFILSSDDAEEDPEARIRPSKTYDLPFGMNNIRRYTWLSRLPISPTYKPHRFTKFRNCYQGLRTRLARLCSHSN